MRFVNEVSKLLYARLAGGAAACGRLGRYLATEGTLPQQGASYLWLSKDIREREIEIEIEIEPVV